MNVQYRDPNITLSNKQTAIAKGEDAGRLDVVGSISPAPVPVGGETLQRSLSGGNPAYVLTATFAGAQALTKLYVGLNTPLVGSAPFYVVVVDTAAALVGGEYSVTPTPKMSHAGDLFFWEPPGGVQFAAGIAIAISSTPLVYTPTAELCDISCWTVP